MKIVVVMPAYNEAGPISQVIQRVKRYTDCLVVVDDGSRDETYLRAKKSIQNNQEIFVLRHRINLGKGAALKTGCQAALKLGADIIITMDADGQHASSDIPQLVEKLKKENLDIVFGSRQISKKIPWLMFLGNKFLTKVINLLTGLSLDDTQSGFRAFTAEAYQKIAWHSQDYLVETEMIVKAGRHKLRYTQVPIQTIYKDAYKGTTILDGIKIVYHLFKWKFL